MGVANEKGCEWKNERAGSGKILGSNRVRKKCL